MKPLTHSVDLPTPIATYFRSDRGDLEAFSRCFTEQPVVKDEGHTYCGRAAIRAWKEAASAKYRYTCEPLSCERTGEETVVICHLVGDFPGSPVDLRFIFKLEGDQIASLEIVP